MTYNRVFYPIKLYLFIGLKSPGKKNFCVALPQGWIAAVFYRIRMVCFGNPYREIKRSCQGFPTTPFLSIEF
ncbi:MAG: hypothetical protein EGP82_07520 [Odoribacter splanchnicus]|nr:hypothetical protein [Odoribacter splanchnicus]